MADLCVTSKIHSRTADGHPIPFAETVEFIVNTGFRQIDYGFSMADLRQPDAEKAFDERLTLCEKTGIRIRYAHLPYDYPNAQDADGWQVFYAATCLAMKLAVRAGTECAAIHPRTFMTRDYDPLSEYQTAIRFLLPYRDAAEQAGLTLALENMRSPGASAPKALKRFGTDVRDVIRMADELRTGICWDTGHAHISGQKQRVSLNMIGNRLKMVHLNDNEAEDDIHLSPFLGTVPWTDVLNGLKEVGYQGALNLEVSCNRLPEEVRPAYAQVMTAAARKLNKMLIDHE